MSFHSFWDVYNQVRDAVDSDFLFRSSVGVIDEEDQSENSKSDTRQCRLSHLQSCEFGRNGVPSTQHEGETDSERSFLRTRFLIYCFPSEEIELEPEYSGRISEGAPGAVVSKLSIYMSANFFLKGDIMVEFSDDEGNEMF